MYLRVRCRSGGHFSVFGGNGEGGVSCSVVGTRVGWSRSLPASSSVLSFGTWTCFARCRGHLERDIEQLRHCGSERACFYFMSTVLAQIR
jgi:hypothetical protein